MSSDGAVQGTTSAYLTCPRRPVDDGQALVDAFDGPSLRRVGGVWWKPLLDAAGRKERRPQAQEGLAGSSPAGCSHLSQQRQLLWRHALAAELRAEELRALELDQRTADVAERTQPTLRAEKQAAAQHDVALAQ